MVHVVHVIVRVHEGLARRCFVSAMRRSLKPCGVPCMTVHPIPTPGVSCPGAGVKAMQVPSTSVVEWPEPGLLRELASQSQTAQRTTP